jgi:hypothetical protein
LIQANLVYFYNRYLILQWKIIIKWLPKPFFGFEEILAIANARRSKRGAG